MLRRLKEVDSTTYFCENFYPYLTEKAKQEQPPEEIVSILYGAIHDFSEGLPPIMSGLLRRRGKEFLAALIPTNRAARISAEELWDEAERASKTPHSG